MSAPTAHAKRRKRARVDTHWVIKDSGDHDRPLRVDVVGFALPYWTGGGVWLSVPVLPNGFIPSLNDSFDIVVGGLALYDWRRIGKANGHLGILPMAGARWKFHLTRDWAVFAGLKFGYKIGLGRFSSNYFTAQGSAGAYWTLGDKIDLRLEVGPWGVLTAGASFKF